jgi:vitamin B12 transporter
MQRKNSVIRFKYAVAAIALLPVSAFAENANTASDSNIVVTATGAAEEAEQSGQAITVVDKATIDSRQNQTVSDLLSTTPGVTVTRNGGIGQPTAVRIRGAEDAQTLVLIDGVRVNDPTSPGGAFDFGNLLTGNVDHIEVLRGPNSVPWGSQALGGVVNIVTAPIPETLGGSLRAEYGYKNSKQIVGQLGGKSGIFSASLGGGYFDDDGISAFKGGTERDGYRQYAANGRVGVAFSENVSVDLRGYYADSKVNYDGFPPPFFSFGDTADYAKTQQIFGYAGLNVALFDGALKNRLAFTINDIHRDSFEPAFGSAPSFIARGRVERYEYQGDATIADGIRAVFGLEHENSRFFVGSKTKRTNLESGYLQAILKPVESLTITGGVRVDDHKTYGTKVTFSANAAWRVGTGTVIRASYGEGFKAPTLYQVYGAYGKPEFDGTQPLAPLQPETAKSYDIGVEQSVVDGTLKVGATVFRRDTRNQIDFDFCKSVSLCAQRPFGYYDNTARTRSEGVEVFVEARPTTHLTFTANYSLIDAKNRITGNTLLRRPKHNINASIDWNAWDRVNLGASVQTVSDSNDSDFQTFSPTTLDGYTIVTIRASVPIGDRFEVFGRIENLFDAKYEVVSGYGTFGRNAHVGVRVKI